MTAKAPDSASVLRQVSRTVFHIAELAASGPCGADEGLFHENCRSSGLRSFALCLGRGASPGIAAAGRDQPVRNPPGLVVATLPQARGPARLRPSGQAVVERAPRRGFTSSGRRRHGRHARRRHRELRGRRGGPSSDHHRPRGRATEQLRARGQRTRRGGHGEQGPSHRGSGSRPLRGITVPTLGSAAWGGLRQPACLRHGSPAVHAAASRRFAASRRWRKSR